MAKSASAARRCSSAAPRSKRKTRRKTVPGRSRVYLYTRPSSSRKHFRALSCARLWTPGPTPPFPLLYPGSHGRGRCCRGSGRKKSGKEKKEATFCWAPSGALCTRPREEAHRGLSIDTSLLIPGRSETESMQYASRSNVYMSVCDELSACARTILCPSQFRPMPRAAGIKVAQPSPHGVLLPADLTKENNHLTPVLSYE